MCSGQCMEIGNGDVTRPHHTPPSHILTPHQLAATVRHVLTYVWDQLGRKADAGRRFEARGRWQRSRAVCSPVTKASMAQVVKMRTRALNFHDTSRSRRTMPKQSLTVLSVSSLMPRSHCQSKQPIILLLHHREAPSLSSIEAKQPPSCLQHQAEHCSSPPQELAEEMPFER